MKRDIQTKFEDITPDYYINTFSDDSLLLRIGDFSRLILGKLMENRFAFDLKFKLYIELSLSRL